MPNKVAEPSTFSVEAILARIPSVRVAVFGDFCLDAYWWLDNENAEKSIETGLALRRVQRQQYSLGGAGNVVANLVDLGVSHVKAVGAIGVDMFGGEVLRLLEEKRVDTTELVMQSDGWQTMVYAKPFSGDEEQNRLDFGSANNVSASVIDDLVRALKRAAAESDVVILNQQLPGGISTPELIARINEIISTYPDTRFIVDARHRASLYEGAIFKLNAEEAAHMLGEFPEREVVPLAQARSYAQRLSQNTGQPVFLTRGENGIIVADGDQIHEVPGIQVIERTDSVGAGDTVVAALAAVIGGDGDPQSAAKFANIAASITVRKLHMTGTATPAEIRAVGDNPDYVYLPELADDARQARFFADSEIEVVSSLPEHLEIQHAIFDHDGTISTLRQGWEEIMEPIMLRAILGSQYSTVEAGVFQKIKNAVQHFIDKTTGVQTLVQMQGLVEMVRQFGFVPADEILDENGYKRIYNEALLEMVHQRVRKLERGELSTADFQVKNVQQLLEQLHGRGVKLYLASGTDETDVLAEAEAMGYAHLFGGRIFGAVGDVKVEAKKTVLERIIKAHNLAGHEFVTFGDGPVEIRETRKRGGICVGVASDEVRRFGLNASKRARLIRAGAHLILPDFSQLPVLVKLLNLN
ncbi:MAG TPA: PfkB family carbohydrate kinase [Pyrinomonadaceae bacterium]|jgi:rfaE bifunctional protein kinase chain/domain